VHWKKTSLTGPAGHKKFRRKKWRQWSIDGECDELGCQEHIRGHYPSTASWPAIFRHLCAFSSVARRLRKPEPKIKVSNS
jgi:hypothetical protein